MSATRLAYEIPPAGTTVVQEHVVPACAPWSGAIMRGEILRIVDLEGQQAVDFLCYNLDDTEERYHAPNTIKLLGNIYLGKGAALWSVRARKMMTMVEDTCGGHDTILGCCSFPLDEVRYGKTNPECCQRNFERELAKHGMTPRDVAPNVNLFMNVPVKDGGAVAIEESQSKPGDFVDLRAEMDVLAVLSNCPEALNPATGSGPTPIRIMHFTPD